MRTELMCCAVGHRSMAAELGPQLVLPMYPRMPVCFPERASLLWRVLPGALFSQSWAVRQLQPGPETAVSFHLLLNLCFGTFVTVGYSGGLFLAQTDEVRVQTRVWIGILLCCVAACALELIHRHANFVTGSKKIQIRTFTILGNTLYCV